MAPVFWLMGLFHAHHRPHTGIEVAQTLAVQCSTYQVAWDGGDQGLMDRMRAEATALLKANRLKDLEFPTICPGGQ
jgi:hypothetical protein